MGGLETRKIYRVSPFRKVCYSVALPYRAYTTELRTRETLNTNDAPKMLVYYAAMM